MTKIDTSTEAVEALFECLMGPWQVCMARDYYGTTCYHIRTHSHASIAVDPRGYFPDGYTPPVDDDGYYQPDDVMDCPSLRIDVARFVAASIELVPALLAERNQLRDELNAAYAIIAEQRGEINKLREALSKKDQAKMTNELKPCPFCGGQAELSGWSESRYVRCTECGCDGPVFQKTPEESVHVWNTRTGKSDDQ